MATEVRRFAVTIPANTAESSPVTTDTSFPAMVVERIDIRVPPGPSGLMGFRLSMNGAQVIPLNLGSWIVTDNEIISWPMDDLPNSGQWAVTGYNTDTEYDHTVYVHYLLSPVGAVAPGTSTPAAQQVTAQVLALSGGGGG